MAQGKALPYAGRLGALRRKPGSEHPRGIITVLAGPEGWHRAKALDERAACVVLPWGDDPALYDWRPLGWFQQSRADRTRASKLPWRVMDGPGLLVRIEDDDALGLETLDQIATLCLFAGCRVVWAFHDRRSIWYEANVVGGTLPGVAA